MARRMYRERSRRGDIDPVRSDLDRGARCGFEHDLLCRRKVYRLPCTKGHVLLACHGERVALRLDEEVAVAGDELQPDAVAGLNRAAQQADALAGVDSGLPLYAGGVVRAGNLGVGVAGGELDFGGGEADTAASGDGEQRVGGMRNLARVGGGGPGLRVALRLGAVAAGDHA